MSLFPEPLTYFMMRRKIPNKEVEQNLMMTEACGATNCSGVARGEQKGHLPPHFFGIVDKTDQ